VGILQGIKGATMIGKDFAAVTVGQDIGRDVLGCYPFALRFGTGSGDAVIMAPDGSSVTLKNIVNGETFPCVVRQVVSVTGTVADIVAVYENQRL
jgi:hypothetical protein